MFHFLNRCLHGFIWMCWIAAAAALWTQREHARPVVDYAVILRDANWSSPPLLPRFSGKVTRVLGESIVQFKADDGTVWNLGLQGCETNGLPAGIEGLRFVAETRRHLTNALVGRPVEFAFTQTNVTRTGLGYFYLDSTNSVLLGLVEAGRCGVKTPETRVLPLREQYQLRVAERQARTAKEGRWGL
jgi:hypothetical protein